MPRTWFSWTDSVLLGSNRLFIVSEMTVPGLRHAKQLVAAIRERLGDGPQPQVIVNRFEQRMFASGLQEGRHRAGARRRSSPAPSRTTTGWCARRSTAACRSTRSSPATTSRAQLKKLMLPQAGQDGRAAAAGLVKKLRLSRWRNSARSDETSMAGRFTARRSAAPEPAPVADEPPPALDGVSWTVLPGAGARSQPAGRAVQSAAHRQAARRQGAPAPPADRGDQPVGAGEAARGRDAGAHPAARHAIHPGRAAGAQHPGAQRVRLRNPRRDDGPGPARAAAQGPDHQRHPDQRPRMRLRRARRPARAGGLPLQGRGASAAHHQQDRLGGRPPGR